MLDVSCCLEEKVQLGALRGTLWSPTLTLFLNAFLWRKCATKEAPLRMTNNEQHYPSGRIWMALAFLFSLVIRVVPSKKVPQETSSKVGYMKIQGSMIKKLRKPGEVMTYVNMTHIQITGKARDTDTSAAEMNNTSELRTNTNGKHIRIVDKDWGDDTSAAKTNNTNRSASETNNTKLVFFNSAYPPYPVRLTNEAISSCSYNCAYTSDRQMLQTADAVVWNLRWMTPMNTIPQRKPSHQKWVFNFYFEAPIYRGRRVNEKHVKELSPQADWTLSYRKDSDFTEIPWRFVPKKSSQIKNNVTLKVSQQLFEGKDMLILWLVSNCSGKRMSVFRELQSLLGADRVKLYGRCGEQVCGPRTNINSACLQQLRARFKFYFAFENSECQDYITEKPRNGYSGGLVPIVNGGLLGRQSYIRAPIFAPENSFLHIKDYETVKQLADHIAYLDKNTTAYTEYFHWQETVVLATTGVNDAAYCRLCAAIHKGDSAATASNVSMYDWWYRDGRVCTS